MYNYNNVIENDTGNLQDEGMLDQFTRFIIVTLGLPATAICHVAGNAELETVSECWTYC